MDSDTQNARSAIYSAANQSERQQRIRGAEPGVSFWRGVAFPLFPSTQRRSFVGSIWIVIEIQKGIIKLIHLLPPKVHARAGGEHGLLSDEDSDDD